jgi:hypothetical protein
MRTLSEPAANILPVPEAKVAAPNAAEVLMKSLRDKFGVVCIALFFIAYPFNKRLSTEVC